MKSNLKGMYKLKSVDVSAKHGSVSEKSTYTHVFIGTCTQSEKDLALYKIKGTFVL